MASKMKGRLLAEEMGARANKEKNNKRRARLLTCCFLPAFIDLATEPETLDRTLAARLSLANWRR